ncbi:MAG TPA: sulfatase-like hydrolase/transferase [Terriglobia bacterium]|nr:sulfatase-like hydrolase/transferase [Terriglobia bacterium]
MDEVNNRNFSPRGVAGRRDFLKASVAGVGAAMAPAGARSSPLPATARRPNILYIHSHDTGRMTSPYGYAVPTPNLQRLAEEGILFRQAYNAAPTCSPSRASLLTGECPHSNGMLGLAHRGFAMTPEGYRHHIVRTLRQEAGYHSALIGLQHIARDPHTIGYDHLEVVPGNRVAEVTPHAVRFLESQPQQPFWLTVGLFETHRPYHKAAPADDSRYIQPPAPVPDVAASRQDMADFHATVRTLDWGVGEVLAALEAAGLADNTLVISTTDHGIAWPMMKCNLYDAGMGVHLVMRGPGGFTGGEVCDALISQLDIFPALCELLQIEAPGWLQGHSFMPVLRGEKEEINEAVFSEVNYHASYEPKRAVRTRRWKYIRHYGGRTHPVLPNCDDGLTKSYWLKNGWAKQEVAPEVLYDLVFDPNERNNLANDPAHRSTLDEMRRRMDTWMHATNDPLLRGPVPAPHGATYNDPNEISPKDPATTVP